MQLLKDQLLAKGSDVEQSKTTSRATQHSKAKCKQQTYSGFECPKIEYGNFIEQNITVVSEIQQSFFRK